MTKRTFAEKIDQYRQAAYPILYVQTHEETRAIREIVDFYSKDPGIVYEWDAELGLGQRSLRGIQYIENSNEVGALPSLLGSMSEERKIFILKDFYPYFEHPQLVRSFRNNLAKYKAKGHVLIFIGSIIKYPVELEKEIQFVSFELPDEGAIEKRLATMKLGYERDMKVILELPADVKQSIITSCKGLSVAEIDNAIALAITRHKEFNASFVESVFSEKIEKIKNNGLLTYLTPDFGFENVGGLGELKKWVVSRAKAFTPSAKAYGLEYPKGMLLCGLPGSGKSLVAKATGKVLNVPVFQVDIGALFDMHVGATEQNFRKMIQIVDAIGPCVIYIDELEKSLNKSATSGQGDSGTSSRSFGTFLTWMSDHTTPVFVIATSNNHMVLPPELIRKGRFDEVFWLGLPSLADRREIFGVVLKRKNRDPKKFDLDKLAVASAGFVGSEIEEVVKSTMFHCFSESERDITTKDILAEIKSTKPQSVINKTEYDQMVVKAKGKLRDANTMEIHSYVEEERKLG